LKLLFISQYVYKPEQAAANRIYDFLQLLVRRGHEPRVIAGGVHYLEDRIDPELARHKFLETRWGEVPVTLTYAAPDFRRSVRARLSSYFSFAWYAWRASRRVGPVDAVMVSIQPIFVGPLGWFLARRRGVPFLLEVRDLWPDAAVEVGLIRSRLLIRLGRWLEIFLYRKADRIVVIGPEMKRVIARKGIEAEKIHVAPQGYQPPARPPVERAVARQRLGIGGEFVLMFAGSFGLANNDLPLLVDAAIRLRDEPELSLIFIGEGNQKAACIERCRQHGVRNVRFLDMVPKAEVHDLLAAADAAVMALPPGDFWKICLQNKIFDYLGNGLPVIAAVAGDQEQLIRESEGGIAVPPGDVEAFVAAVRRLQRDPALRERLARNAREYVQGHLTRAAILSDYVDFLESAASKS
jgi:glycosyltransferase involved in cell wall biosynthesis